MTPFTTSLAELIRLHGQSTENAIEVTYNSIREPYAWTPVNNEKFYRAAHNFLTEHKDELKHMFDFMHTITGFDAKDSAQNAARYDGYLDGLQAGLAELAQARGRIEALRSALSSAEKQLRDFATDNNEIPYEADDARKVLEADDKAKEAI